MGSYSHISVLPLDVLGVIFALNANLDNLDRNLDDSTCALEAPGGGEAADDWNPEDDMFTFFNEAPNSQQTSFSDHPLTVTRRSSQACSVWRRLILDSATLWGALIDLDFLGGKELWREEVMRRAGSTALHIRGKPRFWSLPQLTVFLSILQSKWAQIRKFDYTLMIGTDAKLKRVANAISSAISRPAPLLEHFSLQFGQTRWIITFTQTAPRLTSFVYPGDFDIRSPWMRQLRRFAFNRPFGPAYATSFSASDFLAVLCEMKVLESLTIVNMGMNAEQSSRASDTAVLPRLMYIKLCERTHLCLFLLRHISPHERCRAAIHSLPTPSHFPLADIEALASIIQRYVQRRSFGTHVSLSLADYLSLHDSRDRSFEFSWSPNSEQVVHDIGPAVTAFLHALAHGNFSRTTALELNFPKGAFIPLPRDAMPVLLQQFKAVQRLYADEDAFHLIARLSEVEVLFPRLCLLRASGPGLSAIDWKPAIEEFARFYRRGLDTGARGNESFVLDLLCPGLQREEHLQALEGLKNLKVVIYTDLERLWDRQCYECGSSSSIPPRSNH